MKIVARNGMEVWVGMRFKFKNGPEIHTVAAIDYDEIICKNNRTFYFDGPTSYYEILNTPPKKCVKI